MQQPTAAEMFRRYKTISEAHLPMPHYHKQVPAEKQQSEIDLLTETVRFERFFFVINLHELRIEKAYGVERWLGYADKHFTLMDFLECLHPHHAEPHHLTATVLVDGLMRGDWNIEFMKHRYSNHIALRHRDGRYLCFKRLASVFQYNEKHQLLEYINEFTLIGEYKGQPYSFGASHEDGSRLTWLDEVISRFKQNFENKNLFTVQELRILRKYAYQPDLPSAAIARSFRIKDNTLISHKRNIQRKAEELFQRKFGDTRQISAALKEQGLI